MNHRQQELRHAAARAFVESLEQLDQRLTVADDSGDISNGCSRDKLSSTASSDMHSPKLANGSITVQELEDAVADIEQFTRAKSQ